MMRKRQLENLLLDKVDQGDFFYTAGFWYTRTKRLRYYLEGTVPGTKKWNQASKLYREMNKRLKPVTIISNHLAPNIIMSYLLAKNAGENSSQKSRLMRQPKIYKSEH